MRLRNWRCLRTITPRGDIALGARRAPVAAIPISGIAIIPVAVGRPAGVSLLSDSKVLWSLVVWFAYSALVLWHYRFRLVGRRFAWGVIANFLFVLLTFWGTNLMSSVHN